jgi:hypothetical protein
MYKHVTQATVMVLIRDLRSGGLHSCAARLGTQELLHKIIYNVLYSYKLKFK